VHFNFTVSAESCAFRLPAAGACLKTTAIVALSGVEGRIVIQNGLRLRSARQKN